MKPKSESTSLNLSIDPQTVYISTNNKQNSYAPSITVTVQNTADNTVHIAEVAITLPDTLAPYNSLGSITPVANPSELWDFNPSNVNQGEFDATPVSGNAVPLKPNDEWQFSLLDVTLVSTIVQSSAVVNAVVTFADGTTQTQPLTINISPATSSVTFSSQPSTINPDETSVLSWNCTEIDYVIIDELGSTHWNPTDSADVQPNNTTTYTLYAYGSGVLLSAQQTVTVGNAQIITFGAIGGSSSVNYNANVTFTWLCNQFTKAITLADNKGVTIPDLLTNGNTPQKGTIAVGPIVNPTTFVFTAFGDTKGNFDQAEPTIFMNDVYYTLNASPNTGIWQQDAVVLSWNISSAATVNLSPEIANGPSLQNLVGSTTIHPESDVTYTLAVSGFIDNVFGDFSTDVPLTVEQVSITSFTQSPAQITPDDGPNSCTLSWATNAQVVSINNNIGNVNPNSSQPLTAPDNGTVYILSAGTFQNPGLLTNSFAIINSYGPYTFNSFTQPDPSCTNGVDLMIINASSMAYLKQGVDGGYQGTLTGVTVTTSPVPTELAALAIYEAVPTNPYFVVMPWPFSASGPALTIAWANQGDQSGTITLQPLTESHLAGREAHARLRRRKKK